MDQRSIIMFLGMKGLSAIAIHRELVDVLGSDAITYSAVPKYLRSTSFEMKSAGSDKGTDDPGTSLMDDQFSCA
jgi:hypothetical protein